MRYRLNVAKLLPGFFRQGLSLLLLAGVLVTPAYSQDAERRTARLWRISLAAVAASTALDAASSWNRLEANPLLRGDNGRFSSRGIALKAGIAAGVVGAQMLFARRGGSDALRTAAYTNFAVAGAFAGTAAWNWSSAPRRPLPPYLAK